jgi:hypothetical protein
VSHEYAQVARGLISARVHHRSGTFAGSFRVDGDTVGTDEPEGFREEMGFHGTDKVGRRVSQSAHPVVGPVADELTEPFTGALEGLIQEDR